MSRIFRIIDCGIADSKKISSLSKIKAGESVQISKECKATTENRSLQIEKETKGKKVHVGGASSSKFKKNYYNQVLKNQKSAETQTDENCAGNMTSGEFHLVIKMNSPCEHK